MAELEKQWLEVRGAMLLAARLLSSFGFTGRTLTANNVVIPIAYYLYQREATSSYLTSTATTGDRAAIRIWVLRSLVKRGIWGSGSDTLLMRLRDVLRRNPLSNGWPTDAIESAMGRAGKTLTFTAAEISELAELQYGSARTFAVLALLYPGLNLSQQFHEDHIFPRARFTSARLKRQGIAEDQQAAFMDAVNGLPNLQLLQGPINVAKKDAWPWDWVESDAFVSDAAREHYRVQNDLDLMPSTLSTFLEFYAARRARLEQRLRTLLDVPEV